MRVRPLTGQVLVEIMRDKETPGGIKLPQRTLSPEEQQALDHHPTPPAPITGIVREMGAWRKLRNGMMQLPPFGIGAKVLIPRYAGIEMHMDVSGRFKMVRSEEVLAILT